MKWLIFLLIISVLGNFAGLFVLYKFFKKDKYVAELHERLEQKSRVLHHVNMNNDRRLVFIHHSVGRAWLKDGLRDELLGLRLSVHSASRECNIGIDTDLNHWLPKFKNDWDEIVHYDYFSEDNRSDKENDIIMFKSCYPNSDIVSEGAKSGDPYSEQRTMSNSKAVLDSLQAIFAEHPDKIFIYVTAPPLNRDRTNLENAKRAREFNNWVKNDFLNSYKEQTDLNNLFVFDLFDILADSDNVLDSRFVIRENDSHPNFEGNKKATKEFLKFIEENKAVILGKS